MDASGLIIGAALGGIEGGAKANSQRITEEAENERKMSYAKLMQQYGKENAEFQDKLAGARQTAQNTYLSGESDKNFARDRDAKESDAIIKRAQDIADYDKKKADSLMLAEETARIGAKYREAKDNRGEMGKMFDDLTEMYGGDKTKATVAMEKILQSKANAGKGQLSEYQIMKADEKLAELTDKGVDETNINQVNTLRSRLGMMPLEKVETKPGNKGILGFGSSEAEYEYREAAPRKQGWIIESAAGKTSTENEKKEKPESKPTVGLDKYLSVIKPQEEPASMDIGTILGTITKGGVAGVKALVDSGKTIFEIVQELVAASREAHGESKSAIMEALAKVREVMAAETDGAKAVKESAKRFNQK